MTYDFPVLLALILIVRFCVKSLRLDYPKPPEPSERNFDNGGPVSFDNGGPVMDTKTLVVGQDVYMVCSEIYIGKGKVAKVTPDSVEVHSGNERLRFDKDGNELDVSRRDRLGFGPSPESKFHTVLWQSAPEFGPWHLDDIPFAERTALLEQAAITKQEEVTLTAVRLDDNAVPLLVHASSCSLKPQLRRVIHFEFAADNLPAVWSGTTESDC